MIQVIVFKYETTAKDLNYSWELWSLKTFKGHSSKPIQSYKNYCKDLNLVWSTIHTKQTSIGNNFRKSRGNIQFVSSSITLKKRIMDTEQTSCKIDQSNLNPQL